MTCNQYNFRGASNDITYPPHAMLTLFTRNKILFYFRKAFAAFCVSFDQNKSRIICLLSKRNTDIPFLTRGALFSLPVFLISFFFIAVSGGADFGKIND